MMLASRTFRQIAATVALLVVPASAQLPTTSPAAVGLSAERLGRVDTYLLGSNGTEIEQSVSLASAGVVAIATSRGAAVSFVLLSWVPRSPRAG